MIFFSFRYDHELKKDIKVTVFHSGAVLWMPVATYQSACSHEFRSDSWHCPLLFRSWTMSGDELDLKPFQGETEVDLEVRLCAVKKMNQWVCLDSQ